MITDNYFLINYTIPLLGLLITLVAQFFVNSSYKKFKCVNNRKKLTGYDVARKILDKNGLKDIKILETKGILTDHYDPTRKVIKLSSDIYNESTIASVAVAAHECGHAIQDKDNYSFMKIRASIVPFVNFSTKIGYLVFIIGLIFGVTDLAWIGIILLLAMLLFQLVTLPVEFDASKRALSELETNILLDNYEIDDAKTMLRAAAFTYVASLTSTLLQILRLALIVSGRDDN